MYLEAMSILIRNTQLATLWNGVLDFNEITICHEISFVIMTGRRTLGLVCQRSTTTDDTSKQEVVQLMVIFYIIAWSTVSTAPISTSAPILLV